VSRRIDAWEVVAAVALHCAANGITKDRKPTGDASPYRVALACDKLARIARSLDRLNTDACNVPVPTCATCSASWVHGKLIPGDGGEHKPSQCHFARTERLEKRARDIGAELGIVVTTQRDPRGPAVKMWADKEDGRALGVFS
jgi:hypothetical protein